MTDPSDPDNSVVVWDPRREIVPDEKLSKLAVLELRSNITLPGDAEITAVGIDITRLPSKTTPEEAAVLTRAFMEELRLAAVKGSSAQFAVGDLAMWARKLCAPEYDDLISSYGYAPHTIDNAVWVCRAVPFEIRMEHPVTFTHHRVIAALKRQGTQRQRYWLERVKKENLSSRDLGRLIQKELDTRLGLNPELESVLRNARSFADHASSLSDIDDWRTSIREILLVFKNGMSSDAWHTFRAELRKDIDTV